VPPHYVFKFPMRNADARAPASHVKISPDELSAVRDSVSQVA